MKYYIFSISEQPADIISYILNYIDITLYENAQKATLKDINLWIKANTKKKQTAVNFATVEDETENIIFIYYFDNNGILQIIE